MAAERRKPIGFGPRGQRPWSTLALGVYCIIPCEYDIDYSFCLITFNFTYKLWMLREGTLLTFGHGVKGQDQRWHSIRPSEPQTG